MARILLTGFTAKQRGEGRPQVATLLCGAQLALEYAGHHVERRKVYPDEDLKSQFDAAVIAVYDYRGTSATAQKFNTMRAALDLPHVLAWDDWGASKIFGSMRKGRRDFWALGLHENDKKVQLQREALRARADEVNALVDFWARSVPKMLCCAFNWGDHSKLKAVHNFGELHAWDPSPWVRGIHGFTVMPKKRDWTLASLWNHDKWLDELEPSWPVINQSKSIGGRTWQVEEHEVVNALYGPSWGVLSPPYQELSGSGWWRNRFVFAVDAGCVLYADPSEVSPALGPNSWYYMELDRIESLPDSYLQQVADQQRDELLGWEKPAADSAKQLSDFVMSVA